METKIEKLSVELKVHTGSIEDLQRQLTTKTKHHDVAVGSLESARGELKTQISTVKQLQSQLSDLEKLRSDVKLLSAKNTDLMAHLKRVSAEHEDSLEANERAQSAVRELQNEIHDQTATIRTLRRERASIEDLNDRKAA